MHSRIISSNPTQRCAALAQTPKLFSIEFGTNEVLDLRRAIAITGVTIVPVNTWATLNAAVVDSAVQQATSTICGMACRVCEDRLDG